MITGVMMYQETFLVLRKDRNTITEESEKEGKFPELMIYTLLVSEYVNVQKVINTIAYKL